MTIIAFSSKLILTAFCRSCLYMCFSWCVPMLRQLLETGNYIGLCFYIYTNRKRYLLPQKLAIVYNAIFCLLRVTVEQLYP